MTDPIDQEVRDALNDCLHLIGNQWFRWVKDSTRWARLKEIAKNPEAYNHETEEFPLTSDERMWIQGYQAHQRGSLAAQRFDIRKDPSLGEWLKEHPEYDLEAKEREE